MTVLIVFLLFALAATTLFVYLLLRPQALPAARSVPQTFTVENFLDLNARRFSQIKQMLSDQDYRYLRQRGPVRLARRLRRERLEVLQSYVGDLKSDFENLLHLRRMLGTLQSDVVRQHEPRIIVLAIQFRLLYTLVRAKLVLARLTLTTVDVEPLVAVVNRTAQMMEQALNALAEAQVRQLHTELT